MVASVYIHVPFCAKKCEYCAFYSEASNGRQIQRYVDALVREIQVEGAGAAPETVFFGGGTPSLLSVAQWRQVFGAFREVGWQNPDEFTIECNPATVSADKAALFLENGVNRVSMGVQSMDERLLERLGRVHTRDMVLRSVSTLRQAGFTNLNLDLMFAIPGQSMAIWEQTLEEILAFETPHLSCYEVIYEQDTPLYEQLQAGEFAVDEGLADAQYQVLIDRVTKAGFTQYEIANFARSPEPEADGLPSAACRHNVNYWVGGEYLGLGPAAAGHVDGWRYQNWSNVDLYCDTVQRGRRPRDPGERLEPLAKASETAAFSLRMNRGIDFASFRQQTGYEFEREWQNELGLLVDKGWAVRTDAAFRLTPLGLRFADAAGAELLRT